jgi:hypothetical protein
MGYADYDTNVIFIGYKFDRLRISARLESFKMTTSSFSLRTVPIWYMGTTRVWDSH